MPLNPRKLAASLQSKFHFTIAVGETGHTYYERKVDDLIPVRTKLDHHGKDLPDELVASIARQLSVPRKFLIEMVSCTKTEFDYEERLRANSPVPRFER